ncbi:MAG: hypothetical protein KJ905_00380 [Nanoarchaeota archaeon]|nr:hypothetical protein [Nanoarchaeota archaeon]MBU1501216.1 hypothetical protein [Nanoarchaeota archaeon]MBU2459073.1 hypothetical protein [Nanoarchaeota archaeon]
MREDYPYQVEIEDICRETDSEEEALKFLENELARYYIPIFMGYAYKTFGERINFLQRIRESLLDNL